MQQELPIGNYAWADPASYDTETIRNFSLHGNINAIVEADLDVPSEIHDKFAEFPLLPTREIDVLQSVL
jgi:hypothetical protein